MGSYFTPISLEAGRDTVPSSAPWGLILETSLERVMVGWQRRKRVGVCGGVGVHLARCWCGWMHVAWSLLDMCVCARALSNCGTAGKGLAGTQIFHWDHCVREERKEREKRRDGEKRSGTSGNDLYLLASSHCKSAGFLAAARLRLNCNACILQCLNTSLHQEYIIQ